MTGFRPDPARAAGLDSRVRAVLAESLETVFVACADFLASPPGAQAALLAAVRHHPVRPVLFALYAELVEAVLADDQGAARWSMDAMLRDANRQVALPQVVTLDAGDLGAGLPDVYARALDDDPGAPVRIAAVDAAELARGRALHAAATSLLRGAAPDLLGEIDCLSHETVLACEAADAGGTGFGGASTFYLWGAAVLNSARLRNRAEMAEALAHEAAHAYLLGHTLGAPLVGNDASERFASPLRTDLRPMDGVVHAAFVLARMLWCQDRMLESGLLSPEESHEVAARRARHLGQFADSVPLIERSARFTAEGAPLWAAARDWAAAGCPA